MALFTKHAQALALRKLGQSYSEIKEQTHVSKSTLSSWLKDYPLSKERLYQLRTAPKKIEKYRATMRLKREKRLTAYYENQKKTVVAIISKRSLTRGYFSVLG